MKANSINLQKVFEQTIRYRIPLFQRPYVWNEDDNWQPVWDDVRAVAERYLRRGSAPPLFLGAIVLDQLPGQTGAIEVRQVIDGQQRLTTLQLLLAALRDLAREHAADRYASRFVKLTANDESFLDHPDDEFKVWPTNRDRDDFRRTMKASSPIELRKSYQVRPNKPIGALIPDGYIYYHGVLSNWIRQDGALEDGEEPLSGTIEDRLEALWSVVRSHLLLVAIDLEEDDDAQVIFETLNARGTQLLPADLVKNYLFRKAELEKAPIEELYESYWRRFDDDFWREEVRQGRLKRPRIDLFLQHYLTLKTKDEVNVGHIFAIFKHYAGSSSELTLNEATAAQRETSTDHLARLKQYGAVFEKFYSPNPGSKAAMFFERLAAIDTATVLPFLLEAFKTLDNPGGLPLLDEILVDLESFLTRRMICGLTTKNYNRLFLDLVRDAEQAGDLSASGVRAFLLNLEGESVRWPGDDEVSLALVTKPFYTILGQPKQRMVLQALDSALETGKTEAISYTSKLTIEHLMPQSWESHWPLPLFAANGEQSVDKLKESRERVLHTIGNLTLLTGELNPAVSNGAWKDKRPEILKHSKLNMNRYFQNKETWTEEDIVSRSRLLFDLAKQVWPHPKAR